MENEYKKFEGIKEGKTRVRGDAKNYNLLL